MDTRAVFFDLDGTLVDSLPGIEFSVDFCLAECGAPRRQGDLRPLIGPPIRTILQQVALDADAQQLSELEQVFRRSYNSEGWRQTVVHEGAIDTLARLRCADVPVFLVTNKPGVPTRHILNTFGMAGLFTEVLCRDDRTPPFCSKAEMLEQLLRTHRLDPADCVYVGDSLEDYRAARDAGVPVALVTHGYGALQQSGLEGCSMLNNLSEVLNTIGILEIA